MMESVVVTGIGLVSTLGHSLPAIADALRMGRSGIIRDDERIALGFRSALTGRIKDFDPAEVLSRVERRSMSEPALYGAVAAIRAIQDASLDRDRLRNAQSGVVIGNDSAADASRVTADATRSDGTTRLLGSAAVIHGMNSSPSMTLSVLFGTQGVCWTMSSACASGANAIGIGGMLIESGQQDIVIVGAVQEINWAGMAGFDALGAFSTWAGDATLASRPFSVDRDGLVPSGGGAVLVLESARHAKSRGARIRAMLRAYAFNSDGNHITSPDGNGAFRCMSSALTQSGLSPGQIDYVNAHATSTVAGDALEAAAIASVFGEFQPAVSSTKGVTGHECWMSGASEVAYSLLMAEHGFIAANKNLLEADPACVGLDLVRETRSVTPQRFLSNSFGFGGTNACLIFEAMNE
ncbi:beta-ketoacyl-[acyl-carrier-protein] synthase family protein [Dyella psychrodurans]|uniref:3-oxoacyl-[acyl-carrier-protein] synthase 1 n=1 Tax=Dyella psychrodurans TaxID=1927960 RepID=A0A370XCS9_9GAMM|nr:beta-ketoacyl-[acyl-carrier-protein] synthase family protein [Dyella psychrodurans]RDS86112.1 beta-ketoacyl-[acyl-carrier-protein] synthase family protein [Dyella psychrodurans]